jgi:hypothetical protein
MRSSEDENLGIGRAFSDMIDFGMWRLCLLMKAVLEEKFLRGGIKLVLISSVTK